MGGRQSTARKGGAALQEGLQATPRKGGAALEEELRCQPCPVVHATPAGPGSVQGVEAVAVEPMVVEGQVCGHGVADEGGLQNTSGTLSLYRCRFCNGYVTRNEFDTACRYHPGRFIGRGGPLAPPRHWSCCHGTTPDAAPCAKRPVHTEDVTFTHLARQLGCEMTDAQRAARVEKLNELFGTAFDGNAIRVAVQKSSATVVIRVPAPPTPTIAHVKAILRSDYPHFAGRNVQLGAAPVRPLHPVVPFDDSLPLGQLRQFEKREALHPAQLTEDGALSIFVLESSIRDEKAGTAARGSDWVKVPLHPGDSLAKLALLHNLDVATLKSANNIIGSEIDAWRDDIWLPPLASKRPPPKQGKIDYVARFRIALRAKGAGPDAVRVEKEEAESYLAIFDNDVDAAVAEYMADSEWAAQAQRELKAEVGGRVGLAQRKGKGTVANPAARASTGGTEQPFLLCGGRR